MWHQSIKWVTAFYQTGTWCIGSHIGRQASFYSRRLAVVVLVFFSLTTTVIVTRQSYIIHCTNKFLQYRSLCRPGEIRTFSTFYSRRLAVVLLVCGFSTTRIGTRQSCLLMLFITSTSPSLSSAISSIFNNHRRRVFIIRTTVNFVLLVFFQTGT